MGRRTEVLFILPFLALTACIPAGAEPERAPVAARRPAPRPAPQPAPEPIEQPPPYRDPDFSAVEPAPVWTMQQVVPNAVTVKGAIYIVQPNESLAGIGNRTGTGSDAIARANGLTPPYALSPGQRLAIPAGRYHRVAAGETGIAIAQAYAADWSRIVELNALQPPYMLRPGQRLMLPPEATASRKPTLEERAAAFHIDIDDILTGGQPAAPASARPAPPTSKPKPLPSNAPIAEPGTFAGGFAWPLSGKVLAGFGPAKNGVYNKGIDIAAARGTPIRAAAGGIVAFAGSVNVFGGLVLINHGSGWVTAYGHADRVDVVRGQRIEKGQVIGQSGDTGYTDRPILHFEIRKDRKPVDPLTRLPERG